MAFGFQYAVLRALAKLIANMPDWLINCIQLPLSGLIGLFWTKDRRLLQKNVSAVYGLAPHSRFMGAFAAQVRKHQVCASLETLADLVSKADRVHIEGMEELNRAVTEALSLGKGLIIITAHLGSWEFVAGSVAKVSGIPFNALAKPSKNPVFTKFLDAVRAKMNTRVLWTDSKHLLRDMLAVLKRKQCLGFVMDQKPEGRIGPQVDFFGFQTPFVSGPAKIALRTATPVLAVFCLRQSSWRYQVISESIDLQGLESEIEATQKMAGVIERNIRLYPEQWLWNYKRWRFDS